MNTPFRPSWFTRAVAGLFAAGVGLVLSSAATAGPLPEYTGYTRVGVPTGDAKVVAAAKDGKALGVTVYYMVLDQHANGGSRRGADGDIFGTGIADFDTNFIAGRDFDRRFDTDARYLYLYQVVNDSGREAAVKSVSVRLIIDPKLITSWGYFAEQRRADKGQVVRRGLGFTSLFDGLKLPDPGVRPVSTDFAAVSDKRYSSPAPAIKAGRPYGFAVINLGDRPVAPAAAGDDVGKEAEAVFVINNSFFGEDVVTYTRATATGGELDAFGDAEVVGRTRIGERVFGVRDRDRVGDGMGLRVGDRTKGYFPAVRAVWSDENAIRPRERSTIWGFTSDYPPTYEAASVTSRWIPLGGVGAAGGGAVPAIGDGKKGGGEKKDGGKGKEPVEPIGPAAAAGGVLDTARAALPTLIGTLPTPIPPVATTTAAATGGAIPFSGLGPGLGGGIGGQPGGSGGSFGASPPSPFMAGRGSGGGAGFGGGAAGGAGGGFGGGVGGGQQQAEDQRTRQNGQQNQEQGIRINNNVIVNVKQSQQQQQQQKQQQGQQQHQKPGTPPGNVVPAPPAWLLGVLGLPVFMVIARLLT